MSIKTTNNIKDYVDDFFDNGCPPKLIFEFCAKKF